MLYDIRMEHQRATVEPDGRLLLPKEMRQRLGLTPGAEVDLWLDAESVIVSASTTPVAISREEFKARVAELQALFAGGPSLEDEFLRDRDKDKW